MARRISQCEYCGEDLGGSVDKYPDELVTCGARECERWARDEMLAARDEAHEQLDRDMGFDRW